MATVVVVAVVVVAVVVIAGHFLHVTEGALKFFEGNLVVIAGVSTNELESHFGFLLSTNACINEAIEGLVTFVHVELLATVSVDHLEDFVRAHVFKFVSGNIRALR